MPSLVSPAEVAARCPAAASHDQTDLQLIIDGNEQMMDAFLSSALQADGSATVRVKAFGQTVILLPERVGSITSVVEHWYYQQPVADQTLDPTDYQLTPDGTALERRPDGVTSTLRTYFADEVIVTYVGVETAALRKNVLIQMCCLDVAAAASGNPNSSLTGRRLGDYSEQFSAGQGGGTQGGIAEDKQHILDQLIGTALPVFA